MSRPEKKFSLLIVMNGSLATAGKSTGGGDMVLLKFVRLSGQNPDVLIPESAASFAHTSGEKILTAGNASPSLAGIILLFCLRIIQAVWLGFRAKKKYDVVLSASPFAVDVLPTWFWKARCRGAVIYHVIPTRTAVNLSTRIRFGIAALEQKFTMQIIRRSCDFIVAGNDLTRKQLATKMPGKPIFILPAGFDAAAIDSVPAENKDPNLAVFIGRMVSQKGIFDLLKIMAEIGQTRSGFRLVMVGTGPEREFLQSEINRLGLQNVILSGFISDTEKISLLKKSSFFFFPSYEEGWGIALAEALYCECRCICYELEHYRSIFGDYPVYARLGDAKDFFRAFEQAGPVPEGQKAFLRQYDDPYVVRQLAEHLAAASSSAH